MEVTVRKTKTKEVVPLVSCIFGDLSSVIVGKFWREQGIALLDMVNAWRGKHPDAEELRIRLEHVVIEKQRSTCVTPAMLFGGTAKTTMVIVSTTSSEQGICASTFKLDARIYWSDFTKLVGSASPFCVSLKGCVTNVSGERESRQGVSMKEFTLGDTGGHYVQCMAHGRNAENDLVEEGTEVVVFFGQGQSGQRGEPGKVWLYDEAFILRTGGQPQYAPARLPVSF